MLNTQDFVCQLIKNNYTYLCVVPCSFASNLINEAINNPKITYIPCASEAVAISIASGLKMSGKQPIVIVQSSGLTNMGSCITSLLKPYGINVPIITSWRTYKDGDSEIQHQHLATHLPNLIEAYGYKHTILNHENIDEAIEQINLCDTTCTICILKKDTFSKVQLDNKHKIKLNFTKRSDFLKVFNDTYQNSDTLFIGTTGNTSREMYSFMPKTNNFYMVGNMGGALSLGLGASMGGKKVVVLGGDAEFVMHLGGLTTAGRYKDIDLTYVLFDNQQNKSTGGQNSYQNHLDYTNIAKSCGFIVENQTIKNPQDLINSLKTNSLKFVYVQCGIDEETPRPPLEIVKKDRFR